MEVSGPSELGGSITGSGHGRGLGANTKIRRFKERGAGKMTSRG